MGEDLEFFFALLMSGASIGLMYSLIALGFVLVYKATDAINFAQGEFVMIAGFVAAGGLMVWGAPLWLAIALAIAALVVFGFVLERVMLRKLIGRPVIAVVMATIGLASILRGVGPFTIFSGTKPLPLPIRDEPFMLGPLFIPPIQLLGAAVSLAFLAGFGWFFLKSRKGIAMRAVADDRHRVRAGRDPLGQPARRRHQPGAGRLQGLSGGDPRRARLHSRRDPRRPDRRRRREHRGRLHRSGRRRRYEGLRAVRPHDPRAHDSPLRHVRQAHHRKDLTRVNIWLEATGWGGGRGAGTTRRACAAPLAWAPSGRSTSAAAWRERVPAPLPPPHPVASSPHPTRPDPFDALFACAPSPLGAQLRPAACEPSATASESCPAAYEFGPTYPRISVLRRPSHVGRSRGTCGAGGRGMGRGVAGPVPSKRAAHVERRDGAQTSGAARACRVLPRPPAPPHPAGLDA